MIENFDLIFDYLNSHFLGSTNGKALDGVAERKQLSSVSTALLLAILIGIFEALALSLGSGLFLKLMGVPSVSLGLF